MHDACYLRIQIMTLNAVTQGTFWVNFFSQIIFWIVPYAWDINNNNNNNKKKMNTNCPKCLTVISTRYMYMLAEIISQTYPDILHINFICLIFKQKDKTSLNHHIQFTISSICLQQRQ